MEKKAKAEEKRIRRSQRKQAAEAGFPEALDSQPPSSDDTESQTDPATNDEPG